VVRKRRNSDHKWVSNRSALVIDDETQIRRAVVHALADDFSRVDEAESGTAGLALVRADHPALIVLDLGLPDIGGEALCRAIRKVSDALILVLSARHADEEKVVLLDAGADDYVTKPFSTPELKARVRALLRRASSHNNATHETIIDNGDLRMDLEARTLTRGRQPIHLTPIEWELMRVLMANAGKTMTHRQLFAAVWPGRQYGDAQQYLRVHVASLRRKVEANAIEPAFIITEPGVGYRFAAPD
jgi:two-component system, OmpR family, KDP operon response regulator KdpE